MVTNEVDTLYIFGGRSFKSHKTRNTFPQRGLNGLYDASDIYTVQTMTTANTVGLNDIWSYFIPTNTWKCLTVSPLNNINNFQYVHTTPLGRQYAAVAYSSHKVYVFGGIDPLSNVTLNDVWIFHVKLLTWEQVFIGSSQR